MNRLITIIILLMIFVTIIVGVKADDTETIITCGGDLETQIGCNTYDSQVGSFNPISPTSVPILGGGWYYINETGLVIIGKEVTLISWWMIILGIILLLIIVTYVVYRKIKKKSQK